MTEYLVPVRNEFTGEIRLIPVSSSHVAEAQVQALHELFRSHGWSKATALMPEEMRQAS